MSRVVLLLSLCVCLAACAIPHPRVERGLDVPEPMAVAWPKAVQTTMRVQGQIHHADPTLGMINASVQGGAVSLNVVLTPAGSGTHIVVAHQIAPTHLALGTVTLSDDWIAAYRAHP